MSFLSNLLSGVKNQASSAAAILTSGRTSPLKTKFPSLTDKDFDPSRFTGGQNIAPNISTVLGPGTATSTGQIFQQRRGAAGTTFNVDIGSQIGAGQSQPIGPTLSGTGIGNTLPIRPITPSIPSGPQSTLPNNATPTFPEQPRGGSSFVDTTNIPTPNGGRFVTTSGSQGAIGTSVANSTFNGVSPGGISGIQGGGGSANTGLQGSVGSNLGSQSLTADEENRREEEARGVARTIVPETPVSPLDVPTVPGAIDANTLEGFRKETSKLLSSVEGLSADDRERVNKNIQKAIDNGLREVENFKNQMGEIVSDTQAQEDFINSQEDPVGIRGAMDQKRREIGLPQIESNIVDLQGKINATNEAYQAIFDDIKNNPDLPKGLASRRLSELQKDQKGILQGLVNQLEIATVQRGFANDVLDREFGIIKEENDTIRQRQQDKRTILNTIIDSGALGAYTDLELGQFVGSGFTTEELVKLRDAAAKPDVELRTVGDVGLIQATTNPKTGAVTTKVLVSSPKDTTKVPSGADIKTLFTQFLGSSSAANLDIDQLKSQAVSAGLNLDDPKNDALLDLAKDAAKKSEGGGFFGKIRNFLGF